MFKQAVNNFFAVKFYKRLLAVALIIGVLLFGNEMIFKGGFKKCFSPNASVYTHFSQLASDIIREKNTDMLEHSDMLKYYIITENSQDNTIQVQLSGHNFESMTLRVSTDYNLLSVKCWHDDWLYNLILMVMFLGYTCLNGLFYSLLFNLVLIGLKYLLKKLASKFGPRIRDYFKNLRPTKKGKKGKKEKNKTVISNNNHNAINADYSFIPATAEERENMEDFSFLSEEENLEQL